MDYIFPAVFHKEENEYWAEFPDLEGCQTYNSSMEQCILSASQALEGYILTLREAGELIPTPSPITSIPPSADGFVSYVTCNIKERSVKKTLTIPERLNKLAEAAGINFSQTLQEALTQKLGLRTGN